jgi:ribulose-5-phosphate 4-epimerase/fuculose-1-phosphate aldolase
MDCSEQEEDAMTEFDRRSEIKTESQRDAFAVSVAAARRVLTLGKALSLSRPGTISRRGDYGFLLSEVELGKAGPGQFVEADPSGRLPNSATSAMADAALIHSALFLARPVAGSIVLLRSPRLAAWGLSRRALPVRYFQMFGYTRAAEIPFASPDPVAIAATLSDHPEPPALLLTDGRTLIWAPTPERAARLVLSLEEAAQVTALADQLGGAKDYPPEAREQIYQSLQAQQRR